MKYLVAAFLFVLCISPIDLIPDFIPIAGWVDDLAYIVGAIAALRSDKRIAK